MELRNDLMADTAPNYLRGAAGLMAADLAPLLEQTSGMATEICGDAHLGNFGMYASPERRRVFDLTDFDEARPGPWEWDVCRLATSVVVTARDRRLAVREQRAAAEGAVDAYMRTIRVLTHVPQIERWYALTKSKILKPTDLALGDGKKAAVGRAQKLLDDADDATQKQTVKRLVSDGAFNTDRDDEHHRDRQAPLNDDDPQAGAVRDAFATYLTTLSDALRRLLEGYTPTAVASRPVGEGSLGLRNHLLLVQGRKPDDALVLQVKEATPSLLSSVLEPYPSDQEGQRVVIMQRALQAVSDPLLGWTDIDGQAFYVRQFRDRKGTPDLARGKHQGEDGYAEDLTAFARLCGVTLARAHGRAADNAVGQLLQIDAYIGEGTERSDFQGAVVGFATAYADVTEEDRTELADRIGR